MLNVNKNCYNYAKSVMDPEASFRGGLEKSTDYENKGSTFIDRGYNEENYLQCVHLYRDFEKESISSIKKVGYVAVNTLKFIGILFTKVAISLTGFGALIWLTEKKDYVTGLASKWSLTGIVQSNFGINHDKEKKVLRDQINFYENRVNATLSRVLKEASKLEDQNPKKSFLRTLNIGMMS